MSRKIALIIGNSEYEDANLARLETPDADVEALAKVLREPEIGGFDEVTALVNQPVTSIRRAIAAFFVDRAREDLLLLYFSGHGIRDDRGQLFLAAKDSEHNLLRGTAIPASYITEEMDNSRSRRQVLILDCCHSGAFSQGMKAATGASVGTAAAFEGTGSGRVVLTATDSTQYAWEGEQVIGQADNSVFTRYLIEGLSTGKADSDGDGRITLDELYDYVYEQVVDETPMQTPGKWSYGQQGDIVIARNPHPVVKPVGLPPDLQQTIEDPRPWVRQGAVEELNRLLKGSNPGLARSAYEALQRLADDDSRRVANLAAESLAAYSGPLAAKAVALAESPVKPAVEAAQAGGKLKDKAVPAEGMQPKGEKPESKKIAQELVGGLVGAGRNLISEIRADSTHPGVAPARTAPQSVSLSPVLMVTIAWALLWALGWISGEHWSWEGTSDTVWVVIGGIGGLLTGMILQMAGAPLRWKHILIIALGWLVGLAIGGTISVALYGDANKAANGFARGIVGGLVTGLALWWEQPALHWKQILMVTAGWTVGWTFSQSIAPGLYDTFSPIIWDKIGGGIGWFAFPGAIVGSIGGAIGSLVMFSQLRSKIGEPATD